MNSSTSRTHAWSPTRRPGHPQADLAAVLAGAVLGDRLDEPIFGAFGDAAHGQGDIE